MLAESRFSVEICEARNSIGPPSVPHTEGLRNYGSIDALEELRGFGFDLRPFATAEITIRRSPNFRNVLTGPAYYLFSRGNEEGSLDSQLFTRARKSGVRVRFGVRANVDEVDIVATGSPSDRCRLLGVGFTFSREGSRLNDKTLYALLDNDVAPGGYFAIAPGLTAHSLYSVSWGDLSPRSLRQRMESALKIPWVREILGTSRRLGEILGGAYFVRDPIENAIAPSGARVVGEAGGFQDPIAGYGIRYAVGTGSLAARSYIDGEDYQQLLRKTFGHEFEDAYSVRERLSLVKNNDFDRLIESMGSEMTIEEYRRHRSMRLI